MVGPLCVSARAFFQKLVGMGEELVGVGFEVREGVRGIVVGAHSGQGGRQVGRQAGRRSTCRSTY